MASIAELILARGEQQARERQRQGEISANLFQHLGDLAAQTGQNIEQQRVQAPILAQQAQLRQLQLNDLQQHSAGQQTLDKLLTPYQPNGPQPEGEAPAQTQHPYLGADGLYDVGKLQSAFAAQGVAHLAPEILKNVEGLNDSITKHQDAQQKAANAKIVMLGDVADTALKMHRQGTPLDQALDFSAQSGLATHAIDPQEYQQSRAQLLAMPETQQFTALTAMMDQAAKLSGDETLAKDAQKLDRYGRVKASNIVPEKPNESDIAMRAAGGDSQAIAALKLLKPPPSRNAEQDDQRYRDIIAAKAMNKPISLDDAAWAQGYEKQKTLGPEASAAAATDRQTATIGAQVASQTRQQNFEALKEARAAIQKDVNTPYLTAKTSADTLRDTVTAAQQGNKVAGPLQALEATMSAIRSQGLNRINAAEIGSTQNAGSLYDRIRGWIGKAAEGQPVPPDVQKDMTAFADILEKAAYKKYQEGHAATNKLYGTSIPEMLTGPSASSSPALPSVGDIFQGGKVLKIEKIQ